MGEPINVSIGDLAYGMREKSLVQENVISFTSNSPNWKQTRKTLDMSPQLTAKALEMKKERTLVPLFTVGDRYLCLLSFLLPCYANALVVKQFDDKSSLLLNSVCCITSPTSMRSIVRKTLKINGDQWEDCAISSTLPCCSINQMLQSLSVHKSNQIEDQMKVDNAHHVMRFLSHKMRTPIAVIDGNLSLLEDFIASADELTLEKFKFISSSFAFSIRLIDELTLLGKVIEGNLTLNYCHAPIDLLWSSVQRKLKQAGIDKKLELLFKNDIESLNLYVFTDVEKLQQALVSIVSSAINFAPVRSHIYITILNTPDPAVVVASADSRRSAKPLASVGLFEFRVKFTDPSQTAADSLTETSFNLSKLSSEVCSALSLSPLSLCTYSRFVFIYFSFLIDFLFTYRAAQVSDCG